ncbi:hypothetical protein V6574_34060 [Streptomyces sp. SM1P]
MTGALHALLPDLADRLPPAPPPLGDPGAEHHRVLRALHAYTAALGEAVLVVEDLQWADASTCAFLRTVIADPPSRLGLVLTARSSTAPHTDTERSDGLPFPLRTPAHVTVVERHLVPLSAAETGELAAGLLGVRAVPDEFADRLHRLTGGLPYVVEEVLRGWPGSAEFPTGAAGSRPCPRPCAEWWSRGCVAFLRRRGRWSLRRRSSANPRPLNCCGPSRGWARRKRVEHSRPR